MTRQIPRKPKLPPRPLPRPVPQQRFQVPTPELPRSTFALKPQGFVAKPEAPPERHATPVADKKPAQPRAAAPTAKPQSYALLGQAGIAVSILLLALVLFLTKTTQPNVTEAEALASAMNARMAELSDHITALERTVEVLVDSQPPATNDAAKTDRPEAPIEQGTLDITENADVISQALTQQPALAGESAGGTAAPSKAVIKADRVNLTLAPGKSVFVKLVMPEGAVTKYAWTTRGGLVDYDVVEEGGGKTRFLKSRTFASSDNGDLLAGVSGNYGWSWRNVSQQDVTIILAMRGQYSAIKGVP